MDSLTQQPIADVHILLDAGKNRTDTTTNYNGQLFMRLYPEQQYSMCIEKGGYESRRLTLDAITNKETDTINITYYLTKTPRMRHDTIAQIQSEQGVIKNKNVMDPPGIRTFEKNEIYEVGHFYYEYNKYSLTEAHKIYLDTLLTQLNRHPTMRIEIRTHTDCRGGDAYNQLLSDNRALTIVNYLVEHGISKKRLEFKGLGNKDPIVKCPVCEQCTEEQHYLNRLLEFKVLEL